MLGIEEIQRMSVSTLYRLILKYARHYPSKNQFQILLSIKESFRDNAQLKDARIIEREIKIAQMGLRHLELYYLKNEEMKTNYSLKSEGFVETMNAKDKNFIYF